MSIVDWLLRQRLDHEKRLDKARKQLEKAEMNAEEVDRLLSELERERKRNHYAEMVVGAFVPRNNK